MGDHTVPKKWETVAGDLRVRLARSEWQPDERMPAEIDLAKSYDLSLGVVRQALAALVSEGLIEKRQGIGNIVRRPKDRIVRTTDRYQWEKDRVPLGEGERRSTGATEQDTGLAVTDLDFEAEYTEVLADDRLASAFALPAGTPLVRRVYRTRNRRNPVPFSVGDSYIVRDYIAGNPELLDAANEPWPGGTQHQLSTVGIELDRIIDEVIARPAMADEADALDIGPGAPVIEIRKISIDTLDRVVEIATVVLPGDRTELRYTTSLKRR